MKVFVVLAHPEHQSFNGAMFRPAVATFASNGEEVQSPRHAVRPCVGTAQRNAALVRRCSIALRMASMGHHWNAVGFPGFFAWAPDARDRRTSTGGEWGGRLGKWSWIVLGTLGKAAGTDDKISNYRGRSGCAGAGRRGGYFCGRVAAGYRGDRSAGAAILRFRSDQARPRASGDRQLQRLPYRARA
jgi:hypothetical protein